MVVDLFETNLPNEKLHENFRKIKDNIGHEAGRIMLNEVFNSIKAIDKNFVSQFQTIGFDSRIWELSLLAAFQEANFNIIRDHEMPDFEMEKDGLKLFVEAVTTNATQNQKSQEKLEILKNIKTQKQWEEFILPLRNESTIKIAGGLTSKLKKEYWKKDWVKGNPLIFAIEPFHHSLVHMLSDSNITGYLYGIENTWRYDETGNLVINTHAVSSHQHNTKNIPSNFFALPESENVSAVLFSNSGTISKFSRMGKLKGYGSKNVVMRRVGNAYDHDLNASIPRQFSYTVGLNGPVESWAQGISMFHNPRAKYPIDRKYFPGMQHGYFDEHYYAYIPDFHPLMSETNIEVYVM